ncbi:MAG TPA: alpha/beta fold hydrolase [Nitrospirae bacterium]|nr:alpha/beta fold hydrolase [Nitrospirota bacterium]
MSRPDTVFRKGNPDKPVVIFIHGLGMDKNFWISPLETKILAKNVPLKIFAATRPRPCSIQKRRKLTFGNIPGKKDNIRAVLQDKGFNLVCWSQRRPVGPISLAVEELDEIVKRVVRVFPDKSIALIGHSRGGLIARKFMEKKMPGIKALITLSTPHAGSSLSRIGEYLSPLSPALKKILPKQTHGAISEVIKNVNDLLQGNALKELLPGSGFFRNLQDSPLKGVKYISFGGKKTKLLTLYRWKIQDNKMYPKPVLTIPDSLIKILPASVCPDELISGKGDFMVTAESSLLPWAERHYNLTANHISITWNRKAIKSITEVLERI